MLLALNGELGSGKTTLVRGLARGLGASEGVVSPTFARMRILPGRLDLYHFDAWRGGAEDLFQEGQELLAGDGVAVVEWAERVSAFLPRPHLEIRLAHLGWELRAFEAWLRGGVGQSGARCEALRSAFAGALQLAGIAPLA
jgi:tRNA threonylcarbamoyladenosine biosynthesis protein TsaE